MGLAFANLLEIGGDQYEYIQSVIVDDFLWHTCSDHYHGNKVIDLQLKASFLIGGMKKGPTQKSDRFFNSINLEAKSGVETIYASL